MSISTHSHAGASAEPHAIAVRVDELRFWVELADGRILGVPIARFPVLAAADEHERREFVLAADGRPIHWPKLDEDVGVELLLYYTPPR
jgi:hypothetical protein